MATGDLAPDIPSLKFCFDTGRGNMTGITAELPTAQRPGSTLFTWSTTWAQTTIILRIGREWSKGMMCLRKCSTSRITACVAQSSRYAPGGAFSRMRKGDQGQAAISPEACPAARVVNGRG